MVDECCICYCVVSNIYVIGCSGVISWGSVCIDFVKYGIIGFCVIKFYNCIGFGSNV